MTDKWLNGPSITDLAPHLHHVIPKGTTNQRIVEEALTDEALVYDIHGDLTVEVIVEYLYLWDLIYDFQLQRTWRTLTSDAFLLVDSTRPSQPRKVSS